jgi:hypothetical protein
MVDFSDREEIQRWLERIEPAERRREVAVALAARAALRVLPLLDRVFQRSSRRQATIYSDLVLPCFRAAALPWAASKYLVHGKELSAYASAASDASTAAYSTYPSQAASSAASAVLAASAASPAASVAYAAYAASSNVAPGFTDFGTAAAAGIAADAARVDLGRSGAEIAGLPLWRDSAPDWATEEWRSLKSILLAADKDWEVWTDWYEARLAGDAEKPPNEALEIARASIPDNIWKQRPAVVNFEIKQLISLHSRRPRKQVEISPPTAGAATAERISVHSSPTNHSASPEPPTASPGPETGAAVWDFFISYAAQDEAAAREVVSVIEGAGYSTVAQFKDFPVGSIWVREMNRALAGAARVVTLYSQNYVDSEHCQAEWETVYISDPSGAKRRLIQLVLAPTILDPLARRFVHKAIFGLDEAGRKAAILEAIARGPITVDSGDLLKRGSVRGRLNTAHNQIERDVWLLDAVWRAFSGKWTVRSRRGNNKDLNAVEMQRFYDLVARIFRQRAFDGKLPIWAKSARSDLWLEVPREYWRNHQIDYLTVIDTDIPENVTVEPERHEDSQASDWRHFMTSRAVVESLWPAQEARSP